jgi:hypothetical protein
MVLKEGLTPLLDTPKRGKILLINAGFASL